MRGRATVAIELSDEERGFPEEALPDEFERVLAGTVTLPFMPRRNRAIGSERRGFSASKSNFQSFSLMVRRSPQVMLLAVDLHENLTQIPLPIRVRRQPLNPVSTDFGCVYWTKYGPLEPAGLMGHIGATLAQKIFDNAKRKGKPDVQHLRQAYYFGIDFKVTEIRWVWRVGCYCLALLLSSRFFLPMPRIEARLCHPVTLHFHSVR